MPTSCSGGGGIGQKDKNNGVLILDAVQDRVLRIEVGYGLEGALTDIETAKIRKEYMNPYLAQGDHSSGMLSGYIAVVNEVAGEYGVSIDDIRQRLPSDSKSDYDFYRAYQPESRRYGGDDDFFPTIAFVFIFLAIDGIFFRFRITQTLLRIAFTAASSEDGEEDGDAAAGAAEVLVVSAGAASAAGGVAEAAEVPAEEEAAAGTEAMWMKDRNIIA